MSDSGRTTSRCEEDCTVKEWPHDGPCEVQRYIEAPGRTTSSGWDREWGFVQSRAEAPRPTLLGCSTVSHDRLGFCWGCVPGEDGPVYELMAWRLLALREDES